MSVSVADRATRAARTYLDAQAEGRSLTMRTCAERYGVSAAAVHAAVDRLRREQASGAPAEGST